MLATSDLRVRYGRGRIRFVKWILDPIAALGIYLLLTALVLDRGNSATGLSLACAIVPFQLVLMSILNALAAVHLRGPIIINVAFPRILIPFASVLTESVAFVATLPLLPLMMVIYGIEPTTAVLWLPVAIALTAALALAVAFPSTLIGVWYPELRPFAISVARAAFFLAPGLVALDQITGTTRELLPFNPLTGLFELFRDALLYGQAPAAWHLLAPLAATAVILAASVPIYRREQSRFAKLIG